MANTNINPFGNNAVMPSGYPMTDSLDENVSNKAASAKAAYTLKRMMAQPSQIPSLLTVNNTTDIIYTIDDFYLAHDYVEGSTDILKVSLDLGKTWKVITSSLTTDYGYIVNAFMFADGTFVMCCRKSEGCRIYWTRDFETFTQATVLDYNGNAFSPVANSLRFYIISPKTKHVFVDGVEHFCFWDYILTTTEPRLWYAISDENGVTVRAAFAFGYSTAKVNGVDTVLSARHGHWFDYNSLDGYFYALTGDADSECHIMRGNHDSNHQWTWEKLATGGGYKLLDVVFDEGNLYAVTDYTEASLADAKGLVSIPIDKIPTRKKNSANIWCPASLRYWFRATKDFMKQGSYYTNPTDAQIAAVSGHIIDNNGWRFCGTDYLGGSKHLIAKGDHNFVWVDNTANVRFGRFTGPNNKGEVFVSARTPDPGYASGEAGMRMSHRQYVNLTEVMRASGATDFFEGWQGTPY